MSQPRWLSWPQWTSRPGAVFVFENLESVVAMPPLQDAVVIHGSGYAVDRLGRIPWVREGRIVYWGDLDSHGFGILNRVRATCGTVSTALMDLATLTAYEDLCVEEPVPNSGSLRHLLPEELAVLAHLSSRGNMALRTSGGDQGMSPPAARSIRRR